MILNDMNQVLIYSISALHSTNTFLYCFKLFLRTSPFPFSNDSFPISTTGTIIVLRKEIKSDG